MLDRATVLITGASSGLGAEFAKQLAPRVRCLILAARRKDRLDALAREVAREGLEIHCIPVDLTSSQDVTALIEAGKQRGVSVVINNAGLGDHGLFEDSDRKRNRAMIDVNITALTEIAHGFAKHLVNAGGGGILNVSSIASLLPVPQMAVYAATKAYVTSLTEALRSELRGTGVRVMALCPGPVDTEFFDVAERVNSDQSQAAPSMMKVPAKEVVRAGLAALESDRASIIPGCFVRMVMTAASLTPQFIRRFFLNRRGRNFTGH